MEILQVQKDPEVIMSHLIMNMYKKKDHIQVNPARSEGFPIHLPGGLECTNPTNPRRLSITQGATKIHLYR